MSFSRHSHSHKMNQLALLGLFTDLVLIVQKLDSAIHWINRYPEDKHYENQLHYPLDSNLSSG